MNVIARLEYELAYYDSADHRFNHYTTKSVASEDIYSSVHSPKSLGWKNIGKKARLWYSMNRDEKRDIIIGVTRDCQRIPALHKEDNHLSSPNTYDKEGNIHFYLLIVE